MYPGNKKNKNKKSIKVNLSIVNRFEPIERSKIHFKNEYKLIYISKKVARTRKCIIISDEDTTVWEQLEVRTERRKG